jgi:hypothetical protein
MLLLPEGQTGEGWEPSKNKALLEIRQQWTAKYFHFKLQRAKNTEIFDGRRL